MSKPFKSFIHQRGAVTIIVALSIFVLLGMIGLAIDLGRMYVIKTELQNAADACALAAAKELNGLENAKARADEAGILVGTSNLINFQNETAPVTAASLTYSDTLSDGSGGNSNYNRTISDAAAKYAKCTIFRPNIGMLFMGVLGIGPQQVSAYAVATLASSQTTCALPMGVCQPPSADDPSDPFGLLKGKWYAGKFDPNTNINGSFDWIDFTPVSGGANELRDQLGGEGQCGVSAKPGDCVGEQGNKGGAVDAWNTRFGLIKGAFNNQTPRPDYTGRAYTKAGLSGADATSWPNAIPQNSYNGTCTNLDGTHCSTPNYVTAQGDNDPYYPDPYNPPVPNDPANIFSGAGTGGYTVLSKSDLASSGSQRRIAQAPVVDCQKYATGGDAVNCPSPPNAQHTVPILGWACVLLLKPIAATDQVVLEYLGQPNTPGVPCGSFGVAGDGSGNGPLVPVLVQ